MSNTPSADLFNNFEIPAFETGTTVPAQPSGAIATPPVSKEIPVYTIIAAISVILMFILLIKLFRKDSKKQAYEEIDDEEPYTQQPEEIKEDIIKTPAPTAVEIKTRKEKTNFSTPTNLNKCIRLFLENTRTK